jgi:hypothetical protein
MERKALNVKKIILAGILLVFCFVIPLHVYSIGGDQGIGIQGSFYRYQVTGYGPMMITMMQDVSYVTGGIYSGRTALSIGLWVTGSISLVVATLLHLTGMDFVNQYNPTNPAFLLIGAGALYVVSCIAQFGPFFNGSAGISMPFGGFALILLGIGMIMYPFLVGYPVPKKS